MSREFLTYENPVNGDLFFVTRIATPMNSGYSILKQNHNGTIETLEPETPVWQKKSEAEQMLQYVGVAKKLIRKNVEVP